MATTFDISPVLVLQATDSRARVIDLTDYFICSGTEAANSIITDDPLNDVVIVEEGDEIAFDADQIGTNPTVKDKDGNDITVACPLPPDPPIEGYKVISILPAGGGSGEGDICTGYDDLDGDSGYVEDDEGNTTVGFATSCVEIVTFKQNIDFARGCYGKITLDPLKLEGSLEFERIRKEVEQVNGVDHRQKLYEVHHLRLKPITKKIALLLINQLSTGDLTINGEEFSSIEDIDKNNQVNDKWIIDIRLEKFLCDENIC